MQAWEERLMVKQEGIKEGEKIILRSQISKKLDKKYSAEQIAEMLELDVADVEKIIKELQKNWILNKIVSLQQKSSLWNTGSLLHIFIFLCYQHR